MVNNNDIKEPARKPLDKLIKLNTVNRTKAKPIASFLLKSTNQMKGNNTKDKPTD